MCAYCKMAISQAGYAAEFVDRDGSVLKFDDIGCMVRYVSEHNRKDSVAAFFVMDYTDKHWLAAQQATYVKSDRSQKPHGQRTDGLPRTFAGPRLCGQE